MDEPAITWKAGDVLFLDERAGILYKIRPLRVRLVRTREWTCHWGGRWIDCYELDERGNAVEQRSLYISDVTGVVVQQTAPVHRQEQHHRRTERATVG